VQPNHDAYLFLDGTLSVIVCHYQVSE